MRRLNIEAAQKQQRALELRNLGVGFDRIASELGYADRSGAWRAVKAALDRAVVEPAHEQRIIQSQRLDMLVRQALQAVLAGDLDQIPNVLRVEKRRAELWGLDAPRAVEVSGPDGGPLKTDVGALLLERLQALTPQDLPAEPTVLERLQGRLAEISSVPSGVIDTTEAEEPSSSEPPEEEDLEEP